MDTVLMVEKLAEKGCKFLLTRNFKDTAKTQKAVRQHHTAVAEGRGRRIIVMAIQHETLPDYTILVTTTYPNLREVEEYGFFPVKKDRANWIPIQYSNRKGIEKLKEQTYDHTTNYNFLYLDEVREYLKMAEKKELIEVVYK